ncbi:MAG TPA: hypothetical protein VMF89_17720, partial [Polyangiales bacterium]|nr:hypothetical protein [Polyangiales bacterium]
MRWHKRPVWLVACVQLMAAGCRLYSEELLNIRVAERRAADAGRVDSAVPCGDGKITGDEKCDVGIPSGTPGACPTQCPALAQCAPRELEGTACQSECAVLIATCGVSDGCCPAQCSPGSDSDCSRACGDGIIDAELGETCETESKEPCPASEKDCADDDPCTTDRLIGSAKNCNALCVHMANDTPKADDGCCPRGVDSAQDSDCSARCGNGEREAGEDCDGSDGCS